MQHLGDGRQRLPQLRRGHGDRTGRQQLQDDHQDGVQQHHPSALIPVVATRLGISPSLVCPGSRKDLSTIRVHLPIFH